MEHLECDSTPISTLNLQLQAALVAFLAALSSRVPAEVLQSVALLSLRTQAASLSEPRFDSRFKIESNEMRKS